MGEDALRKSFLSRPETYPCDLFAVIFWFQAKKLMFSVPAIPCNGLFFKDETIDIFSVEKKLPSSVLQVLRLHPFLGHKLESKIETGKKRTKHRSTTKQ